MPGTALWVDGFICLPVSPFICLPLSPRLDAWHGSLGGRVRLSPWVHLSPFVSLHLSPVDPVWVDGFICLPLSFVSRCLPAWMPGTALWVDGFICLPLSPFICLPAWMAGAARVHLSPFVSPHLSPVVSQPGCLGGQIHLFPFVSLYLCPVVSQPGCLARLSGWTDSFVSRCLPAWMCGTHAPRFPSLPAVLSFWRGLVCLRLWPLASVIPCLVDVGDRVRLCLPFIWTSISLGLVVGRLPCLSLATPCLFVQCLVISCGPELTIAVRCGARLQLREGSVNPPVKQT